MKFSIKKIQHKELIAFFGFGLFLIWLIMQHCSQPAPKWDQTIEVKKEIQKNEQKRDSTKKEVANTEVKQIQVKKAYRHIVSTLGPSTTPCRDTILQVVQLCDTVIFVDSVLIGQLKEVIKLDSVTIDLQKQVIHTDSLTIIDLTKKVQKETRKKKFWRATTLLVSGVIGGILLTK